MTHTISIRSFAIAALCMASTAGCAAEAGEETVAQDEAKLCPAGQPCGGGGGEAGHEIVMLTGYLPGANGSTAPGVFLHSGVPTTVVKWPAFWVVSTSLRAGMPCSPYPLAPGQLTEKTILAFGSYRKCM
jgi:hypothetical protein